MEGGPKKKKKKEEKEIKKKKKKKKKKEQGEKEEEEIKSTTTTTTTTKKKKKKKKKKANIFRLQASFDSSSNIYTKDVLFASNLTSVNTAIPIRPLRMKSRTRMVHKTFDTFTTHSIH